jgi:2-polyprenyl-3-methyl-5-hydroxy-6-metoxy-1,4-benzoquinol methylase
MTRDEIEKTIEPVIAKCQQLFGETSRSETPRVPGAASTKESLRPDVRRVSLILALAQSVLGTAPEGEGLEIGSGFGYLLFPMAKSLPGVRWTAAEHPDRSYVNEQAYLEMFRNYNCELVKMDMLREPFPFADGRFLVVTFSEVLEHLPMERLNFVLSEIARVIRPGGILIASSPNQASLENRALLLRGRSILAMPDEIEYAKGTFGHIRLYTPAEIQSAMEKAGFGRERLVLESNNSAYRGASDQSWRRRLYRIYERAEQRLGILRGMGDTWYMVLRKNPS